MEFIGYLAIFLAGISMGLIGAGGSILSVPILVYLFRINPVLAAAYSLFLVGVTSSVGAYSKYKNGEVSLLLAVVFGVPSMFSVFLTRKFLLSMLPDILFANSILAINKEQFLMVFFAILMLFAARSVLRKNKGHTTTAGIDNVRTFLFIALLGLCEGFLTGLVGAGGGFIIIPILILFARLPMKIAIGTSMLIIAVKSIIGFGGDLLSGVSHIDFGFLLILTSVSVLGMFFGNTFSRKVDGSKLKKGFGLFILLMGGYIFLKELFF